MNRVILFGHLGHSPRLAVRARVTHFPLAVDEYQRNAAGELVQRVTWFDVVAWNELAERAEKYLRRGDQILVEGRIELREFEGRDGTKRAMLRVTAFRIEFGAKARREEVAEAAVPAAMPDDADDVTDAAPADEGDFETVDDEDLPF